MFRESPAERNLRNQFENEKFQIKNEDSPTANDAQLPNDLSNKENIVSSDANRIEQCVEQSKQISRHARSVTKPPKSQFEQICGAFGQQPCTCYYPDHPDVTIFELSSDEITLSKMNGTGPSSCADIQAIGNSLKGFYMVRLNDKRIEPIYCDFNQTNEKTNTETIKMPSTNQRNSSMHTEFSQFCKGLQSQPCRVFYSDYPDIRLFYINRITSSNNVFPKNYLRGPTNCEDLHAIGYYLKGFYWVSLNANKVKLVFCDFNEIEGKDKKNSRIVSQNNTSKTKNTSSTPLPHCNAVGSQPCSCYYSKVPNVLQFELSNDELTRQATMKNGTGPESCEELKNIGYTLDGFHMVRFKTNMVIAVYCKFNYTEIDENNEESTTQSTLKPSSKIYFFLNSKPSGKK